MAEPIDPHGPETTRPSSAPKPDASPAAEPSTVEGPVAAVNRTPGTSGSASSPSSSTPKPGGEVLPSKTQAPASRPAAEPSPQPQVKQPLPAESLAKTRAAAAWLATGAALIILGLIIILILQNQQTVEVNYLWFSGSLPLGAALLIAAVAGAAIVMIVGTIRLTQVRRNTRRAQKAAKAQPTRAAKKG